ncbi:hypothetical protein [Streptomyces sp. P9-A2]|uniref:hypothetical protein n=1 Tax=Streptomyces sp. P9-A2 TaxID=3072284 RepID=UPI002FC7A5B5
MADLATPACADNTALRTIEPSDLEVAISVAQQLLHSDQILSLQEALRLLLRALGTEPATEPPALRCPTIGTRDQLALRHDEYRVRKAREELAAPVDLSDDRAMARRVGRLEVALEQLLEMLAERGEGQ